MAKDHYSDPPFQAKPLARGLNVSRNETQLGRGETPDCLDVEFNRDSVLSVSGGIKFNNQVAPGSAVRTRVPRGAAALSYQADRSVPAIGHVIFPYDAERDIGGDFAVVTGTPTLYHHRQGPAFQKNVSFMLPPEEQLYETTKGDSAPSDSGDLGLLLGHDEAFEDTFLIAQKGGDGPAPMSWALGVVNVGDNFENLAKTDDYDRPSNYALVFMWLDAPGWEGLSCDHMKYDLADSSDVNTSGARCTMALRAILIEKWIEPGKRYRVALGITKDTADGALFDGSTFFTTEWNHDGRFQVLVSEEDRDLEHFGLDRDNWLTETENWGSVQEAWTYSATAPTVTRNTILAPDTFASQKGDLLNKTLGGFQVYVEQQFTGAVDGSDYTFSIYVAQGSSNFTDIEIRNTAGTLLTLGRITWSSQTIALQTGSGAGTHTVGMIAVTNPVDPGTPWYRARVTFTNDNALTSGTIAVRIYPASDQNAQTGTVNVWGAKAEIGNQTDYVSLGGVRVWKGPEDSIDYLIKYGIRYSSKDAEYLGLGLRQMAWSPGAHFIPWGFDHAPMERGGFRMVRRADTDADDLVPPTAAGQLTVDHQNAADDHVVVSHQGLVTNGAGTLAAQGYHFTSDADNSWKGLGANGSSSPSGFNSQALRGYRLIMTKDVLSLATSWDDAGGILSILSYDETGAFRMFVEDADSLPVTPNAIPVVLQAFRWNQRPLIVGEYRTYSSVTDYTDSREALSVRSTVDLEDATEPKLAELKSYAPMDDAEGGVCRELLSQSDGFLRPFGMGVARRGTRGESQLFLSGEGEALVLDLSDNPVFQREFLHGLKADNQGFAVELTVRFPMAFYGIDGSPTWPTPPSGTTKANFAPTLVSWGVADSDDTGMKSDIRPLMALDFRGEWTSPGNGAARPLGLNLRLDEGSDQEDVALLQAIPDYESIAFQPSWGNNGEWVGKDITIQAGIQSTGTADEYEAYLVVMAKQDVRPADGDPSNAELLYKNTVTVAKKDVVRSRITIGGDFDPGGLGYTELNCPLLVDEVKVFGAVPSGAFPSSFPLTGVVFTGGINTARDGKLEGPLSLPTRELTQEDLIHPLGPGLTTADVVEGSTTVTAPAGRRFFEAGPEDTIEAVEGGYLIVRGDERVVLKDESSGFTQEEFYRVDSTNGTTLTLNTPFADSTRENASAGVFRVVGYTAFRDDLSRKKLSFGSGRRFRTGTTTSDDVVLTESFFRNLSPVSGDFKLRIYSPGASAADLVPLWDRGLQDPRANPITGAQSIGEQLFMSAKGCLYEVDDRWRSDGPSEDLEKALAFRAVRHSSLNVALPLQRDWAESSNAPEFFGGGDEGGGGGGGGGGGSAVQYTSYIGPLLRCVGCGDGGGSLGQRVAIYDAWVKLAAIYDYQTILFLGSPDNDQSQSGFDREMNTWVRFRRGRPEFVVGSNAQYGSTGSGPEGGLFIATGGPVFKPGEWFHIRWSVFLDSSENIIKVPRLSVMGKEVGVSVNATDDDASLTNDDDWLRITTTPTVSGPLLVGVAKDSYRAAPARQDLVVNSMTGRLTEPQRLTGYMHGLGGELARVVMAISTDRDSAVYNFDPYEILYNGSPYAADFRAPFQEGVGHRFADGAQGSSSYGVIVSHPFISQFHELGNRTDPVSFAPYDQRVFLANGGRPVTVGPVFTGFAGTLPPTTAPGFELEKFPLWEPNVSGEDPVPPAAAAAGLQENHFRSHGNNYLRTSFDPEMAWSKDDGSGEYGVFGFKGFVNFQSTSGRVPIYSARSSKDSGGIYIEMVDGFLELGWYDTYLKSRQSVRTTAPVIVPGAWYYLNIRKKFPEQDGTFGNYEPQIFSKDPNDTLDNFVFRQLMTAAPSSSFTDWPPWAMNLSAARSCIGCPTEGYTFSGAEATGLVTLNTTTYTGSGAADGIVDADSGAPFHPDMRGMIWQWGSGSNAGTIYRVNTVVSSTRITVVDSSGSLPTFSEAAVAAGVFMGVALRKSTDFDSSKGPDAFSDSDIEMFGSRLAGDALSGEARFDGKFDSFAIAVINTTSGSEAEIFETGLTSALPQTDEIERGTDDFGGNQLYSGTMPGHLSADGTATFLSVHTKPYGGSASTSTQPNTELEVDKTTESSVSAQPLIWQHHESVDLFAGRLLCNVVFHDPLQGATSAPGPTLIVLPTAEDGGNPAGAARLILRDLPISRDGAHIERWIYLSQPDGVQRFRVKILPDNTSTSLALDISPNDVIQGSPIRWDLRTPPDCWIVGASNYHLVYAALRFSPDALMYSLPYRPAEVPPANFQRYSTGEGRRITGLADLRGKLVVFKRKSVHKALLRGISTFEDVTTGAGCEAHQSVVVIDNRVVFLSEIGWYVYSGTGVPVWVGWQLEDAFNDEDGTAFKFDKRRLSRASSAINVARKQIVTAVRLEGDHLTRNRITLEIDSESFGSLQPGRPRSGFRYTRARTPNITVLASVDRRGGGLERLVAGTEEGFAVWLDRSETESMMLGAVENAWGANTLTADTGATSTRLPIKSGLVDTSLEGARGAVVRWRSGNAEREAVILAVEPDALLLEVEASNLPAEDDTLTIGATLPSWETPWMDLGLPHREKRSKILDIVGTPQASGTAVVEVFIDFDETTDQLQRADDSAVRTVDLTKGHNEYSLAHLNARYFKVRISHRTPTVETPFEITEVLVRSIDADQH